MNYYKDKATKILTLMEYARRLYEQAADDELDNRNFGAGALWAFACVLNEEDEYTKAGEFPQSFDNLLEKINGDSYKRKFCEGCRFREDARLASAMLRPMSSLARRLTTSGTPGQRG